LYIPFPHPAVFDPLWPALPILMTNFIELDFSPIVLIWFAAFTFFNPGKRKMPA